MVQTFLFNVVIKLCFKNVKAVREFFKLSPPLFFFFKSGKCFYFSWPLNFLGFGPVGRVIVGSGEGGVRGKKEHGRDLLCDSPSLTQSSSIGTSGMRVCNNQLLSDC